jgi:xylan 1,4-beta-xylosidase
MRVTLLILLSAIVNFALAQVEKDHVFMADPFVLEEDGIYYLYGTMRARKGIMVYKSTDLENWKGPVGAKDGFALAKEDVYGDKHIMGAYLVKRNDKYLFYYVATDKPEIAVAIGDSPLGPFTQEDKKPLKIKGKSIAPHIFTDDDGSSYMYYTKLDGGNKIYVVKMDDDLLSVKENTG